MDHYKVYDEDGKLLVSDIVVSGKSDVCTEKKYKDGKSMVNQKQIVKIDLISFDTKYFLNTNHFKCELIKKDVNLITDYSFDKVKFDINNFSKYPIVKWHEVCDDPDAPIYRDYAYDELDPEVECLVHTLNSLPAIITSSSCSGHGTNPLFVMMNIFDFETIHFLINIINVHFHNDFYLGTHYTSYMKEFSGALFVELISNATGNEAYAKAKELVKVIEDNKNNIYPNREKYMKKLDGKRVQVLDLKGKLLVDDTVRTTFHSVRKQQCDFGYIHKNMIKCFCYISFDNKYYLDINSKFFTFNIINSTELYEQTNYNVVKFNIDNFKSYRIDDIDLADFTNPPICVNNECDGKFI